ncbi:dihydrofolate reductase family protein [Phenylobacterium sp.]|uniref:dihydrofolate reductase family protein n=1 Tax=Phenylobacterium sp. TaxID=1871053 RepID=UPI002811B291|nr:dihydrofolate reductase family protein [Phenylobacterium sp.]
MRKLILSQVVSLDGFTTDPNGEFVPPPWSDQVAQKWSGWAMEAGGLFVYGRVNFEYQRDFWTAAEHNEAMPEDMRAFAREFNKRPRAVVSRTLKGDPGWAAEVLPDVEAVGALKAEAGKDMICFGGADIAHSLADADLIDEYRLMLVPYTLGGGKRLFDDKTRRDFELAESITTDVGSLILTYARKR